MSIKSIKTGTKGVTFKLGQLNNYVAIDINPDGAAGNGKLGWSRILETNNSGFAGQNMDVSYSLDDALAAYKEKGATSVALTVTFSNWRNVGSMKASIDTPHGSTPISVQNAEPYSSRQFAFTLEL